MIDQRIFEDLQTKIDEETTVRDVSSLSTVQSAYNEILRVPSQAQAQARPRRAQYPATRADAGCTGAT